MRGIWNSDFSVSLADPGEISVEVHPSPYLTGKRELGQSFVYFVPWEWLRPIGSTPSEERASLAFWNSPDKAPIIASLPWDGSVYRGMVTAGSVLAMIEKIGNNARMTGPWYFDFPGNTGNAYMNMVTVDDRGIADISVEGRPVIAELIENAEWRLGNGFRVGLGLQPSPYVAITPRIPPGGWSSFMRFYGGNSVKETQWQVGTANWSRPHANDFAILVLVLLMDGLIT